jgi:Mg2+ and Co2+ transporter CorA
LRDAIEDPNLRAEAQLVSDNLMADFVHLLDSARSLSGRCNTGMAVIGNNAMLEENRQATLQARRVARLTFIAFVFVPLSFTTSLFGMNVSQLGTGHVSIAVWAGVSASVVIATTLMFFFDGAAIASAYKSMVGSLIRCWSPAPKRQSIDSNDSDQMV